MNWCNTTLILPPKTSLFKKRFLTHRFLRQNEIVGRRRAYLLFGQAKTEYAELFSSVTGKWETIIAHHSPLLPRWRRAFYAILQAVFRPRALIQHIIILLVVFLGAWQVSSIVVRQGLSEELHSRACLELHEKLFHSATKAATYCSKKNPIRLKYAGPK